MYERTRPRHSFLTIPTDDRQSSQLGCGTSDVVEERRFRLENLVECETVKVGKVGDSGDENGEVRCARRTFEEELFERESETGLAETLFWGVRGQYERKKEKTRTWGGEWRGEIGKGRTMTSSARVRKTAAS
jgi:hypothetical protein